MAAQIVFIFVFQAVVYVATGRLSLVFVIFWREQEAVGIETLQNGLRRSYAALPGFRGSDIFEGNQMSSLFGFGPRHVSGILTT